MIGNRIPRFLLYSTALGAVVAVVMLTLFYAQYRWLANQIVSVSYEEHRALLEASYERRARADLHGIADQLPIDGPVVEASALDRALNRAMVDNADLNGLQLTTQDGETFTSGNFPQRADEYEPYASGKDAAAIFRQQQYEAAVADSHRSVLTRDSASP